MEKALKWLKENEKEAIKLIPKYDIEEIAKTMQKYADEQLLIQRVSQRSELLPKITPHLDGHEPTCNCEPCDLLRKIFGNCG
ncbi:hypothetical protein [Thalassobellus suaedae]|uniref:Uncharacterized protein n=1 Tax=Thalassobellus suaedae TaxID=3074124 RepID=A0ABY9XVN5_9FLAO|nr:hypothetical protein RHP51_04775 [Flavobacteriaceae bacterium HL-DH14]